MKTSFGCPDKSTNANEMAQCEGVIDHIWVKRKKDGENGPYTLLLLLSRNSFLMRVRGFVEISYVFVDMDRIRAKFFFMIDRVKYNFEILGRYLLYPICRSIMNGFV